MVSDLDVRSDGRGNELHLEAIGTRTTKTL